MELGKAFLGYWECIHRNQSGKIHTAFKTTLIPSWLQLGLICCEFELSLNETDFELNFKFESNFDLFKFELTDLFELKLTPPFSRVNWIELHCGGWSQLKTDSANYVMGDFCRVTVDSIWLATSLCTHQWILATTGIQMWLHNAHSLTIRSLTQSLFLDVWLVVWNILFFHILGTVWTIIPTDELICFRGVGLNHQPGMCFGLDSDFLAQCCAHLSRWFGYLRWPWPFSMAFSMPGLDDDRVKLLWINKFTDPLVMSK